MPSLAQMTGALHIHQFYIDKLKAKQEHTILASRFICTDRPDI